MAYNDKIVTILDSLSKTVNTYNKIVGNKITSKQDFLERESTHSFVHDQFLSALNEIKDFQPTDLSDRRKDLIVDHFTKITQQHKNVIDVFGGEYSFDLHEKYDTETEKLNNLLDELKNDIIRKTNK